MILESVKQGPLIWPSVEVEGVTRLKKYSELSTVEAIQADCDVKSTNIILMILASVEQGPLLWPSVEEDGVTRLKKYTELSAVEAIQADCNVKVTNIILQGLPPEVYALVSTHKQATINNGRVTIQPIQGRQNNMSTGSSRLFASGSGGTSGKQRVIVCYNCKGEGHMSKLCTKPKRKRDAEWFKDKADDLDAHDSDCDEIRKEF
nr:hypothetical protein [Tanacetum cinerariifolium]